MCRLNTESKRGGIAQYQNKATVLPAFVQTFGGHVARDAKTCLAHLGADVGGQRGLEWNLWDLSSDLIPDTADSMHSGRSRFIERFMSGRLSKNACWKLALQHGVNL
jgi:hypothetical protein